MITSEDLINQTAAAASTIFPLAQSSVVYRASLAYILQNIKSFISAIQPLKTKDLTQLEIQALQRLNGLFSHFGTVLPHLGSKWLNAALNWPSTHMHNYIDGFRKTLTDICTQLSLDPSEILKFDPLQDQVNKRADLEHLRKALRGVRESAISCTNSVDVQQLIQVRLHSISNHLPSKKENASGHGNMKARPSSDSIPVVELKQRMDKELAVFNSIDIPCEDLRLDEALGCGGFGTVFCAVRLSTAELLAVKEVRSDKLTMSTWASLYSEVATMAPLKHKYVLELVGAHIKEPYRIITRFCPGKSLFDRLHRSQMKPLTAERLTAIAYQVAEGMRFLHSNGIVHRDLKTMNILLDNFDTAKIADFGLAGMMKDNKELIGGVGTPHYTAPEVLERKRYGPKVDTYSYGVILWEMANRQIPFRDKTHQEIYDNIVNRHWRLPFNSGVPENLKRLIIRCWSQNPNDRPEFSEIVKMFEDGQILFQGCQGVSSELLDPSEGCPPLDIDYLTGVLKDPTNDNFSTVVHFLVDHIDDRIREVLQDKKIVDCYHNAEISNSDSILLLASEILAKNEFPKFIDRIGLKMISHIINFTHVPSLVAAAKFCLKVPNENLKMISQFIPTFVDRISQPELGPLVVRIIARLESKKAAEFTSELIDYFTPEGVNSINDQDELDALSILMPHISDKMSSSQLESFVCVLEKDLDIPLNLIELLIEKISKNSIVRLTLAIVKAGSRTDITEHLIKVLKLCSKEDLEELARHYEIFDEIQHLLDDNRLVTASLFVIFELSKVPSVPTILANHPLLQSILQIDGHVAQRLQIFTSLFSSEQFCTDTTISEGVLKLLVSSMNDKSTILANYSLKLIGALTSHPSGCALISETGMLSLFSQMFLSSTCGDTMTSLTILSNAAKGGAEIPQISLIVSCLMQDLLYSVSNKIELLKTLIQLINLAPNSVQDHDIQNSVLPLLSPRQEPEIVVLVMKLLCVCDITNFRCFYHLIAQKVFSVLTTDSMLYPEVIEYASELIAILSAQYDMSQFLQQTKIGEFVQNASIQLRDSFIDISTRIEDSASMLISAQNRNMVDQSPLIGAL
ncbi:TKL family protein kinase [Tritrichomonas foetus]|uniref:TKL family protein kinase n=1 Tax=Tritrichomonas foetus TaxID=1144522 RepID=A0A1J4JR06_9EUKA|nr:TKL family protein kinase [Tritrichomonas foetus]|eukprot:OHS99947.1 TKL family protein kinase [Tritrichomonas foetus]